jgi:hypothetical protein
MILPRWLCIPPAIARQWLGKHSQGSDYIQTIELLDAVFYVIHAIPNTKYVVTGK